VAAVVSIAGSIGVSPLADQAPPDALALVPAVPGAQREEGDGRALGSLRPNVRQQRLATYPVPRCARYYSLVTAPEPDRVSAALRPGHRRPSRIDPHNDGALLPPDQLVPGGVLLGYVNAEHWAVALPIAESNEVLGRTLANRNEFPRDALWEALVRYVAWDLARRAPLGRGAPSGSPPPGPWLSPALGARRASVAVRDGPAGPGWRPSDDPASITHRSGSRPGRFPTSTSIS
jgi:hypothetical protein